MPDDIELVDSEVGLGVITAGQLHLACVRSLLKVYAVQGVRWVRLEQIGPYLDVGRNNLIRAFNMSGRVLGCKYLLMVDSDVEFTMQDVEQLVEDDLPIVSGIYYSQLSANREMPVVYRWKHNEETDKTTLVPVEDWGDGWPIESAELRPEGVDPVTAVDGVGGGFLMIRTDVLDALEEIHGDPCPWFYEEIRDGFYLGEDLAFCLRAADAGFQTYVDRRVQVAHHKTIRLGGGDGLIRLTSFSDVVSIPPFLANA